MSSRILRVGGVILLLSLIGTPLIPSSGNAASRPRGDQPVRVFQDAGQAEPVSNASLFMGSDRTGNFQRALEDAIARAESVVPCCDRLITYQVVDVRGLRGGFAGFNTIEVTIDAKWN